MAKKNLTNERLKIRFKSNFDLTNIAIKQGRETILAGKYTTLDDFLNDIRKKAELAAYEEEDEEEEGPSA
ncbi:MAG TPA: hypothetical protein VLG44_06160 [Chlamydiales bacterium]|nr:hypothetical protein [Chlamydiales bacterium]